MITCDLIVADTLLTLDARKVIFWREKHSLFIADLHLGKITHFRKSGMAIPAAAATINLDILESLFIDYEPRKCYFLGDLFHSATNHEWFEFQHLCLKYSEIDFYLIAGNHDLQLLKYLNNKEDKWLKKIDQLELYPFLLTHEPEDFSVAGKQQNGNVELYRLSGHIHPKIKLVGKGKQHLSMPCFYFSKKQGILPSFGQFTGGYFIKVKEGDQIFGVMDHCIHPISLPK
ncbi:MAG: hypothetical protein RLZZ417_1768 [Bacteroidota bacterium]|jgi:DNA ligase-associated metallophosphoesterase